MAVQVDAVEIGIVIAGLEKADADLAAFQERIADQLKATGERTEEEVKSLSERAIREFKRIQDEETKIAQSAAEEQIRLQRQIADSTVKTFSASNLEPWITGLRAADDQLDLFDKNLKKSVQDAAAFAQAGAKLGGVWGAAIGVGISILNANMKDTEEKLRALDKKSEDDAKGTAAVFAKVHEMASDASRRSFDAYLIGQKGKIDLFVSHVVDSVKAARGELDALDAATHGVNTILVAPGLVKDLGYEIADFKSEVTGELRPTVQAWSDAFTHWVTTAKKEAKKAAKEAAADAKKAAQDFKEAAKALDDELLQHQQQLEDAEQAATQARWDAEAEVLDAGVAYQMAREQALADFVIDQQRRKMEGAEAAAAAEMAAFQKQAQEGQAFAQQIAGYFAPFEQVAGRVFDLVNANVSHGEKAFKGLAKTAKAALADLLKSYAREWALKAIVGLAAGFAALGSPLTIEFAAPNFKSAALYGAAAVAAGVGGLALSSGSASASSGGGGSSSAGGSSGLGRSTGQGVQVQAPSNITISFGLLAPGDTRSLQQAGEHVVRTLEAYRDRGGRLPS